MAVPATAVWRVRTGGNSANGGAFDSTAAGVDYTQQDAAQATWTTSLSMAGTTTLTDSGGNNLFTSQMIGNAVNVGGLFYFITGYTNANNVTVDRSATFTNQSGRVGGALADFFTIHNNATATHGKVVPGNKIYIRGAGSEMPGSNDYSTTGFYTPVSGDLTSGPIWLIGENGRPRIAGDGLMWNTSNYMRVKNLYFAADGTNGSASSNSIWLATGSNLTAENCCFDSQSEAIPCLKMQSRGGRIIDSEFWSGSTSPTSSATGIGIITGEAEVQIIGCYIHHLRGDGIQMLGSTHVENCLVAKNVGNGINVTAAYTSGITGQITGNTIDDNDGHGITIADADSISILTVYNNLITNHNQASKYGLTLGTGTTALNDRRKTFIDYNAYYNNTSNYNAISAGDNDVSLSADPYTDASTEDWSLNDTAGGGAAAKEVGFGGLSGSATTSLMDIGAAQVGEGAGGGGGMIVHPGMNGGLRG